MLITPASSPSKEQVLRVIAGANFWHRTTDEDGAISTFYAVDIGGSAGPIDGLYLTASDLAKVHENLPVLLENRTRPGTRAGDLNGGDVRASLKLWSDAWFMLPTEAIGDTRYNCKYLYVESFDQVYPVSHSDRMLAVNVKYRTVKTLACGIDYDKGPVFLRLNLSTVWMDQQYPGWRERFLSCTSLDIPPNEVMSYLMCIDGPGTDVALPEIEISP